MNIVTTILTMALIGSLIGAFTNYIAIKMLFRPYNAVYLGKWRLPFTPGLIPKRRDELSTQLGRIVVDHLLTPETFKSRFLNEDMHTRVEAWIQQRLEKHVFQSGKSFQDWLEAAGQHDMKDRIEVKLDELVDRQYASVRSKMEGKTIRELMPESWKKEADRKVHESIEYALGRATAYFESFEGRQAIRSLVDEFLLSRGRLGNMLQSLFGESTSLIDRIQPEIIKFLQSPKTYEMVSNLANDEWEKLQNREADELLKEFDFESAIESVKQYVREKAAVERRLEASLAEIWPNGLEWAGENVTPLVTDFIFQQGEAKLEETMLKIDLQGMVKEQVDSLPLARLEELVVSISKRELKLITVLGAVLGGLIGVVQGILALVINTL
nr:DUF445 family protein [Planomicrobium sp. YIM 101495]